MLHGRMGQQCMRVATGRADPLARSLLQLQIPDVTWRREKDAKNKLKS